MSSVLPTSFISTTLRQGRIFAMVGILTAVLCGAWGPAPAMAIPIMYDVSGDITGNITINIDNSASNNVISDFNLTISNHIVSFNAFHDIVSSINNFGAGFHFVATANDFRLGPLVMDGNLVISDDFIHQIARYDYFLSGVFGDVTFNALAIESATAPEPSAVLLMGVGLLGLFGYVWRQRRPHGLQVG